MSERGPPPTLLLPAGLVLALFVVWPLLTSMPMALTQTWGPGHARFVGLQNFRALAEDPLLFKAVANTAIFAVACAITQIPTALLLALALHSLPARGRSLLTLAFFAPQLVGTAFVAAIAGLLFAPRSGLINQALHSLSPAWDPEFPWLSEYALPALVLASFWTWTGFHLVLFLAALQSVERDQLDAARVDGASAWERFRHVIWPAIRPTAALITLMSLLGSAWFFELGWVLFGGAGPENRALFVVTYLFQTGFEAGDLGYASATGWLLALALSGLVLIERRLSARGEP